MEKGPGGGGEAALSPRTTRAVATMTARIRELFRACPDEVARAAALRWSRTCPPRDQEREARITHDETVRNALAEEVRWTRTDWARLAEADRADALARKRVAAEVRAILAGWKGEAPPAKPPPGPARRETNPRTPR